MRVDPQVSPGSTPFQGDAIERPAQADQRMDGPGALTGRIYVASSWRNQDQPIIVRGLRAVGFDVYDFRHPDDADDGFHWSQVYGRPGDAAEWVDGVPADEMVAGLDHPLAVNGFALDMAAMKSCDTCVLVLPCGRSAHLELGWFVGQGCRTAILLDDPCQPELMYKMVDLVTPSMTTLFKWLGA